MPNGAPGGSASRSGPRERVRTARALEDLPQTADALRGGSISYTKVRALTRVATPESETKLLALARAGSAAKLERMVRMWRRLSREGELKAEEIRHQRRAFSAFVDDDGMYVGRRSRTIPPHIRRALDERDRGCRFPGCRCRFTEAHHVKHWADGGETSLENTLLLCRRHHRAVHEGQVKASVAGDGTVLFFTPKGRILADAPKLRMRANAPGQGMPADAPGQGMPVDGQGRRTPADAPKRRMRADATNQPARANSGEQRSDPGLSSVPSVHPDAPSTGEGPVLSNGAALYNDSAIPWEIEAAAREAVDG